MKNTSLNTFKNTFPEQLCHFCTIFQCRSLHIITVNVKLSAINIADRSGVAYTSQHSKLTCRMGIALCKQHSAQFFLLCLCLYLIYIIIIVYRVLKQCNQYITNTSHNQWMQFILTEFFTNLNYTTAKLNKLIKNIIKKNKKSLFTLSSNGFFKNKTMHCLYQN